MSAAGVRELLNRAVEEHGLTVAVIAARANLSSRTVYRVLQEGQRTWLDLDLGDRLLVAVGGHLSDVEVREV